MMVNEQTSFFYLYSGCDSRPAHQDMLVQISEGPPRFLHAIDDRTIQAKSYVYVVRFKSLWTELGVRRIFRYTCRYAPNNIFELGINGKCQIAPSYIAGGMDRFMDGRLFLTPKDLVLYLTNDIRYVVESVFLEMFGDNMVDYYTILKQKMDIENALWRQLFNLFFQNGFLLNGFLLNGFSKPML